MFNIALKDNKLGVIRLGRSHHYESKIEFNAKCVFIWSNCNFYDCCFLIKRASTILLYGIYGNKVKSKTMITFIGF
jgi:hypothetical protein